MYCHMLALRRPLPLMTAAALATSLAACSTTDTAAINDPLEPMNRGVHAFNKGVDTAIARPVARVWRVVTPEALRLGLNNMADTLDLPGVVVNQTLQARPAEAATNSLRFAVNATAGLLGLVDVATVLGMPKSDADFGQTLAVWGVGGGPYMELPLEGPSNARDAVGFVVDLAMNPLDLPKREANGALALEGISRLNDRVRYRDSIDSVLYESADSYAQMRLLYQQNRRFEIEQASGKKAASAEDGFIDPYADDDFIDPYAE